MEGICCKCSKEKQVVFYKQEGRVTLNICNKCLEVESKKDPLKELQAKVKTLEAENKEIKGFNTRCIRKLETIAGVLQI